MRKADLITAIILLLLSAVVIYEAYRLGFGWGLEGPQPGFFIFWLGVGLAACSAVNLFHLLSGSVLQGEDFISTTSVRELLKVCLPMIGAILLMELLGFYIASALYLAFFMRWVGRFRWRMVLLVAFLFALSHYFVFERWFLVPLPKGLLEPYIGL